MRRYLVLLFIFKVQLLWGSPDPQMVSMLGKIVDAETQQPVEVQLKYQLLPVGHTTGIRNFANGDGSYQLPLQPHRQYQLEVTAPHYQPLRIVVQTDSQASLPRDILLHRIPQPGELITLSQPFLFERGKPTPAAESQAVIDEVKRLLQAYPTMKIRLEGHTDRGNAKQLMQLSGERAEAIKDCLVDAGIRKRRIKTEAFGNTQLLSQEDSFEARQRNRRVEVRIIEL
ncbi:MAG: OmpA family protein [Tunicatimonas sp.]